MMIQTLLNKNFQGFMKMLQHSEQSFTNVEELISSPNITPSDYKELFSMFVFDVTKQSEKLKNSVTDIQIKAQFSANVAANTEAFTVVISDKSLIFQSDGNKIRVEY